MVFFLQPRNEGQELNYIETFRGSQLNARRRAKVMRDALQKDLPQANISVSILDKKGEHITEY